ncbi:hypothetical protein [Marinomonas sp. MED121]|nr:hypothetical protein [Marinomonas sp. MED121]
MKTTHENVIVAKEMETSPATKTYQVTGLLTGNEFKFIFKS